MASSKADDNIICLATILRRERGGGFEQEHFYIGRGSSARRKCSCEMRECETMCFRNNVKF